MVAVTPQLAEHSLGLIEKHKLKMDLLSDPGSSYAAELGIRFALPEDLKGVYLGFGNDLAELSGDPSWSLPMPTRLVVSTDGVVRAADINPNYTQRPEPQKTVDDVKALG